MELSDLKMELTVLLDGDSVDTVEFVSGMSVSFKLRDQTIAQQQAINTGILKLLKEVMDMSPK